MHPTSRWTAVVLCALAVQGAQAAAQQAAAPPPPGPKPLSGSVRTLGGTPIPDAEVTVDDARTSFRTSQLGAFSIPNVSKGIHTVSVRRIGYLPAVLDIEVPQRADSLVIVLVPSRAELDTVKVTARSFVLAGVVVDERNNRPIPGASVALIGQKHDPIISGPDGWFTFKALHDGPVIVRAMKDGYVAAVGSVRLEDWRGVVIRMAPLDSTLSRSKLANLAGTGNTQKMVWYETQQRLNRRNARTVILTGEELDPLRDLPLGDAILRAPSATNLLVDMQENDYSACVLLNGNQLVGQIRLNSYNTEDVEFVELYPMDQAPPYTVTKYLGFAGCTSRHPNLAYSGVFYAVIWMKQ